ncbi:MAG: HNH endonuclease [Planctomycetaceae bacterium]|jgi:uncharacterized protein (TIGR02646 family)|nr:HNH endonuclease [Planctomycetaceae bacterium]
MPHSLKWNVRRQELINDTERNISMRPVNRGQQPEKLVITKYQDALPDLSERFGRYCSYCEMQLSASLAVEHIMPKSKHPDLELKWENYLLSCVHCNSIKGNKDINVSDYFFPDRDNTFAIFDYSQKGIAVSNSLNPQDSEKAQKTLQLTGLDRLNENEKRFIDFTMKWNIALRSRKRLNNNLSNVDIIESTIDLAKESGHFSIWMTVFADNPDMKRRFIEAFPGTETRWFDENGNSKPSKSF